MNEENQTSETTRNTTQHAQAIDGVTLSEELSVRSRSEMRRVIIPEAIQRWLPPGTELNGTFLYEQELGGDYRPNPGLRLTIPFGPKRAAITFD